MTIIALCGQLGSGKDTAASTLKYDLGYKHLAFAWHMKSFGKKVFEFSDEQLWGPSQFRNAVDDRYRQSEHWEAAENRLALLGPDWIYELCSDAAPLTYHSLYRWFDGLQNTYFNKLSPRVMLQTLGTEWGRQEIGDDVWVNATLAEAKRYDNVVISDVRFENEVSLVKDAGGKVIRIYRDKTDGKAQSIGVSGHESEVAQNMIPEDLFDASINNNGTLKEFKENVLRSVGILETL